MNTFYKVGTVFFCMVIALVIVAGIMDVDDTCTNDSTVTKIDTTCSGEGGGRAMIESKDYVRATLRSPSTADFPFWSGWSSRMYNKTADDSCSFVVKSYVDAQNAFGGTVRQHYTANIKYHKGNWSLKELNWR